MNIEHAIVVLGIISFFQGTSFVQNSYAHNANQRIVTYDSHVINNDFVDRMYTHRYRWRSRKRIEVYFSTWTNWSQCDNFCSKRRERYCKVKRKCGYTKYVEEKQCWRCPGSNITSNVPLLSSVINIHQIRLPVFEGMYNKRILPVSYDYFMFKNRKLDSIKKRQKKILINIHDNKNLDDEVYDEEKFIHFGGYKGDAKFNEKRHSQKKRRNLSTDPDDLEYDEDVSEDVSTSYSILDEEDEAEYDNDERQYKNSTTLFAKEKAVVDPVPLHRRIFSKWSKWTKCSPKCTMRRYKKCKLREQCGQEVLREIAYCYTEGSFCQQWLHAQQKSQPFGIRPVASHKKDSIGTANLIPSDFIISGKGYRGPEYAPMKLKCGIAPIKNIKRNMYSMLKIIGGKASRKGEWPWQVAIFNRFKEAFCGGTLVAPQWILTAAHCVRKVLYVRLGEHNLDYDDGTELQFRVAKSIKHPNFDKKTVDSDIALLRLPRPVNATTWMGFSCLPRPFQPLPKNMDCTVIGWGKRRNRDQSGTSILHQAEVPIIPMENCKSVYHDYTITKNMFCAGHRRGRIDTCAGDSGGPLLCRDSTKPNHPYTIFGITSFGDGCAKRNKFGIYAKVPNYVDWIWSVVNCNGNCKPQTPRRY